MRLWRGLLASIAAAGAAWILVPIAAVADGSEREVDAPRIVSLAPHLTELAFEAGIGDRLVGAVAWSDFPAEAARLPRIGDAFRLDLERIVRLRATHALAWPGGTPTDAVDRIEALGIVVVPIAVESLDDLPGALEELGQYGADPGVAKAAAAAFRTRHQRLAAEYRIAGPSLAVFYQVSRAPLFTLGARHVINDVFALCGARNIFEGLDAAAAAVDLEAVLARDPTAIIGSEDSGSPSLQDAWREHGSLRAVRCDHVLEVDPDLLVRPTTRLLDGAASLCAWLDEQVRGAEDPDCRFGVD